MLGLVSAFAAVVASFSPVLLGGSKPQYDSAWECVHARGGSAYENLVLDFTEYFKYADEFQFKLTEVLVKVGKLPEEAKEGGDFWNSDLPPSWYSNGIKYFGELEDILAESSATKSNASILEQLVPGITSDGKEMVDKVLVEACQKFAEQQLKLTEDVLQPMQEGSCCNYHDNSDDEKTLCCIEDTTSHRRLYHPSRVHGGKVYKALCAEGGYEASKGKEVAIDRYQEGTNYEDFVAWGTCFSFYADN